ncbi:MAG TPA: hypothetical protein VHX14_10665 [Thermoanaerobaculia bacterium]|jgi:hypothetical protein|nr:hypothetical protein [Thermoanaerobaculia bacterium]
MGTPVDQLQAIRRIRDYAVALSLAPEPLDREEAERLIATRQATERSANSAAQTEQKRLLTARVADLSREISVLEATTGGPEPDGRIEELRQQRVRVAAEMNSLHATVRRRREEYEAQLVEEELRQLDIQEKEAVQRVTSPRLALQQSRIDNWHSSGATREKQRQRLTDVQKRLQNQAEQAEGRLSEIREPLVSRTVAGFLLWAGYSAIAATGAAVAFLLREKADTNILTDLSTSMGGMAADLSRSVPPFLALPVGIVMLVSVLASIAAAVWLCDKLIQTFDKNWRKRQPNEHGFSRTALGLPSPVVGRRAYVQVLALLPFAYIAGLGLFAMTYRAANTPTPRVMLALTPAILHTAIGSVVTLLAASVFVLYLIKVIESRAISVDRSRRSWEIASLPLLIVLVFAVGMARSQPDRFVWGCLAAFMVLSTIGLAYGVVYRGMFRDVDEVTRLLRTCEADIEELDTEPELDDPTKAERNAVSGIERAFRQRRQGILDDARRRRMKLRDARPDFIATQPETSWSIRRWFRRNPTAGTPDDWRLIDAEAAPEENEGRSKLRTQLADIDEEITRILQASAALDSRTRLIAARTEHLRAITDLESEDARASAETARLFERQAIEIEEFRRAFEIGSTARPAFIVMRDRTTSVAKSASQFWRTPEVHP